jgi:5-methyltetrahydropteroyltriglutamate--homocysteine methyltransferase
MPLLILNTQTKGPEVYDIHSPRVPTSTEIITLLEKAAAVIPVDQLW